MVESSSDAYIVHGGEGGGRTARDLFAYGAGNLLVDNYTFAPAFEVEGELVLKFEEKGLIAATGDGMGEVNGVRIGFWRAVPVPPNSVVRIRGGRGPAYLAVMGLSFPFRGRYAVSRGTKLRSIVLDGWTSLREIAARRVPRSMIERYRSLAAKVSGRGALEEGMDELLERLSSHISLVKEAVMRGAKLIKVRVSDREYEIWVEELE